MGIMTYEREKVAPWERYTDGQWHQVRTGPEGESRAESLRQYRRHADSMRTWAAGNGWRGQISRRESGRLLSVRFSRLSPTDDVRYLQPMSRGQLGRSLMEALELLDYAMHLRMHGERAPGGDETWAQFDRDAEMFLRKIRKARVSDGQ